VLAIIPARGGSTRYPDKNIKDFLGQPLIYHALDSVESADAIVMASDSIKILEVASKHKFKPECIQLPPETTTNKSTVIESILWLLQNTEIANGHDVLGMFLPTAPLRKSSDVKTAMALLNGQYDIDGVISTTDYDFPPTLGLVKDNQGYLHCADKSLPFLTNNTRSQDHTHIIRPNGAIYLKYIQELLNDQNFFSGRIMPYHMPKRRSPDIDTEEDMKIAEMLAKLF
jgi:CMP-N,N'-diacetyllegionaminic acid synthase